MSNIKKLMMSAAGGDSLDVDDVFSTYLYQGNGSSGQTISNNLDLGGEGGITWIKQRDSTGDHVIIDPQVHPDGDHWNYVSETYAPQNIGEDIFSFSSTGFTIAGGLTNSDNPRYNGSSKEYVSWTFRKAPKFFDVVTYTGNGTSQTISHNLGTDIGFMIVRRTSGTGHWIAWHKDFANTAQGRLLLNLSANYNSATSYWNNTAPTSTGFTVGSNANTNASGDTYVAYLFAHNDGDGEFGPDGDQDIIKCGSYAGNGNGEYDDNGTEVDLGFEPQWVMVKSTSFSGGWMMHDTMRGIVARTSSTARAGNDAELYANESYAENPAGYALRVTPTGFKLETDNYDYNGGPHDYIYMAIRRGSLFPPESASEVFAAALGSGSYPCWTSGFPIDMAIDSNIGGGSTDNRDISSRLTQGRYMGLDRYSDEDVWDGYSFDYMTGYRDTNNGSSDMAWMWKRAPGFFDVVTYKGNGVGPRNVPHNLGVVPEMIWNKKRSANDSWFVYHKDVPLDSATQTGGLIFQSNGTPGGYGAFGEHAGQTATTFEIAPSNDPSGNNQNNIQFISYLFATLDGISKVGNYTGNGSNQTINCGFSAGARFILIKRIDASGDWYVWDTARGINAGSETGLIFNSTSYTYNDSVDPANSGFIVNQVSATNINVSSADYIFYAIA